MFVKKNKKTTVCDEIEIYTMIKIMGLMRNYDNLFTFICSHIFLLNKKIVFSYHKVLLTNIRFTFRRESKNRYSLSLCSAISLHLGLRN